MKLAWGVLLLLSFGVHAQLMNQRVTSKCIQTESGVIAPGPVSAKTCNGSPAQAVTIDGTQMKIGGMCIGVNAFTNGSRLNLQTCDGSPGQNWKIEGRRFSPAASPSRVMDLHGQNQNDVILWDDYGDYASSNQRWIASISPPPPPPPSGGDTTPNAFDLGSDFHVPLGSHRVSSTITVSGIDAPAAISVTNGLYSIGCTASFTGVAGTIGNGQSVCVSHTASASPSTTVTTTLNIGGVTGSYSSITQQGGAPPPPSGGDTTPNAFDLGSDVHVPLGGHRVSSTITVSGIDAPAAISVTNGLYSIGCTASFTNVAGIIVNGQSVCVSHIASASPSTTVTTTLNIGGVTGSYSSITAQGEAPPPPPPYPPPPPPSAGSPLANQRVSSKCIQTESGAIAPGPVSAKACNGSSAQSVAFDGTQMKIGGMCIGVNAFTNGSRLNLQACNGSSGQSWRIEGSRFAAAASPSRVMDLHGQNQNDVILWDDYGASNQRWTSSTSPPPAPPPPPSGFKRIMPLGDSITGGDSVPGGYRILLEDLLVGGGVGFDFVGPNVNGPAELTDKNHAGYPAQRIEQIAALTPNLIAQHQPNVVLLKAGTNDIAQQFSASSAPARLMALVASIHAQSPQTTVLVASLYPFPFRQAVCNTFNDTLRGLVAARKAQGFRVDYVDMTSGMPAPPDGVHPPRSGYDEMARRWFAVLPR